MEIKDAIYFIECLAKGVNPISGEICNNDSVLNDVNVVRRLYEIRDYMNGSLTPKPRIKKTPFVFKTKEGIIDGPTNMSVFIEKLNKTNIEENMRNFTRTPVIKWLIDQGLIDILDNKKVITEKGYEAGIYYDHRISGSGREYSVITYPVDLLLKILNLIDCGEIN